MRQSQAQLESVLSEDDWLADICFPPLEPLPQDAWDTASEVQAIGAYADEQVGVARS